MTGQPLMLPTSDGIQTLYVSDGIGNPVGLLTDYSNQSYVYNGERTLNPCSMCALDGTLFVGRCTFAYSYSPFFFLYL